MKRLVEKERVQLFEVIVIALDQDLKTDAEYFIACFVAAMEVCLRLLTCVLE